MLLHCSLVRQFAWFACCERTSSISAEAMSQCQQGRPRVPQDRQSPHDASAVAGPEHRRWPFGTRTDREDAGGGRRGRGAPQERRRGRGRGAMSRCQQGRPRAPRDRQSPHDASAVAGAESCRWPSWSRTGGGDTGDGRGGRGAAPRRRERRWLCHGHCQSGGRFKSDIRYSENSLEAGILYVYVRVAI